MIGSRASTPWAGIEWATPWLGPYAAAGATAAPHIAATGDVAAGLVCLGPALRFVPAKACPPGVPYESHIHATGDIPTRDNLHDFFNGLVWHVFPRTKRQLNAVQAEVLARTGVGATRGPVRDAATVFDENGALLQAPEPLWDALAARDWRALFVTRRALWAEARLTLFGHALLEQLVSPRKSLTAHVLPASIAIDSIASLDAWLADDLAPARLAAKPFHPLPVLGVPGWWSANADPVFYDDPAVFRPHRPRAIAGT